MRIPKRRTPTHPGEMLRAEFLEPMNVSQTELARAIHVPFQRINELINGRRGITPGTALRLARHLGTTPGFWMNLQQRWDLFHASLEEAATLRKISRR